MPSPESVRRRQSGVLVVGMVEPEVTPWLRAAGHAPRTVRDAKSAVKMLEEEPADLVIVDREPAGMDAAGVCRTLREGVQLSEPWLLAITVPAKGRGADSALTARGSPLHFVREQEQRLLRWQRTHRLLPC